MREECLLFVGHRHLREAGMHVGAALLAAVGSGSFSRELSISYKLLLINVGTQFYGLQCFMLPEHVHTGHRTQRGRCAARVVHIC